MTLHFWTFELPFTHPFTISRGTKTHQPTLIVALQSGNFVGYGEAPAIDYYNVTTADMVARLQEKKTYVEKFALTDPERYWHYLHHLFPNDPFLVCALDMAGWDLFGKMNRKSLHQIWNTPFSANDPVTNFTIGIDTVEKMVAKMKEKPWPVYKVKLGAPNDLSIIETLRSQTDAVLRVDANAGWTVSEALELIPVLYKLGVEMVEQPLNRMDWDGMNILYSMSPLPLYADESCVAESDVEKCAGYFHGINIKLTKCSGITPARRMIVKARELGLKVMMGCMNESTIGSAAIVQFIPQLDLVDADGPLLLSQDLAAGITYNNGITTISQSYGLGIDITFH